MFDTHCHLNSSRFKKDLNTIITDAIASGVNYFVVPGSNIKSSGRAVEIAKKYKQIYAAVGIHPTEIVINKETKTFDEFLSVTMYKLREFLENNNAIVAIGEIGLNHYEGQTEEIFEMQKPLFISQLQLAIEYKKSIIIHNRGATEIILNLLKQNWHSFFENRVVFHCCEANIALLSFAQKHGVCIGVDGDITFSKTKAEFIKRAPLELLVVETDAPYLLPEPLRTQKMYPNKPEYLKYIIHKVAEIKNVTLEEVIQQTTLNGKKLFRIK